MLSKSFRRALAGVVAIGALDAGGIALSQTAGGGAPAANQLPETTVTAPSPIRRTRPRAVTTSAPAATPQQQPEPTANAVPAPGTLPVVTDQFATVTVVTNEE